MTAYGRQFAVALRFLILATVVLGVVYPLVIWAVGAIAVPAQAAKSIVSDHGRAAASSLIVQNPQTKSTQWFFPRPSAVKGDPSSSAPSNLGQHDPQLAANIAAERSTVAQREHVAESAVPRDAVTESGSGLDPDVSVAYAQLQAPRVAAATGLGQAEVAKLIAANTTNGLESLLGQQSVNVTTLNLDLARALGQ